MYNNEYEEYMRNVLGYPIQYNNDTYNIDSFNNSNPYFPYRYNTHGQTVNDADYESMYPEIYKILHPMILKKSQELSYRNISMEIIDSVSDDIYNAFESNENINTRYYDDKNLKDSNNQTTKDTQAINNNKGNGNFKKSNSYTVSNKNITENVSEAENTRSCCQNPALKDLIKILLLNQLIYNNRQPAPPPPGYMKPHNNMENPNIYANQYPYQPYKFF